MKRCASKTFPDERMPSEKTAADQDSEGMQMME